MIVFLLFLIAVAVIFGSQVAADIVGFIIGLIGFGFVCAMFYAVVAL